MAVNSLLAKITLAKKLAKWTHQWSSSNSEDLEKAVVVDFKYVVAKITIGAT